MINCPQCEGFLPPTGHSCPNCDYVLSRWALRAAKAVAGAATALTLMACYGGGYDPPYDGPCQQDYDDDGVCSYDDCDDHDDSVGTQCDCVDNDQDGICAEDDCDDFLAYDCPCVDNDGDEVCAEDDCDDADPEHGSFCPNLCSEAMPLVDLETTGSTLGMDDVAVTCAGGGNDAAYSLVVGGNPGELQFVTISLTAATAHQLSVRQDCTGAIAEELSCAAANEPAVELLANPGDPLWIVVEAASVEDEGDFTLQVTVEALVCGDMLIVGPEECDDGNTDNGDGCDEFCRLEQP
jgi:cysteine-rich repeat protein